MTTAIEMQFEKKIKYYELPVEMLSKMLIVTTQLCLKVAAEKIG